MRRSAVLAAVLVMVFSGVTGGVALAKGPDAKVKGTYTYNYFSPVDRLVSVDAKGHDLVKGSWSWQQQAPSGSSASGTVSCLVVDGQDAWMAGPATTAGYIAAFLWVHDGGLPNGAGDMAVTWIADPGETLADMVTLCQHKATVFTPEAMTAMGLAYWPGLDGMVQRPLTSGNLDVRSAG